MNPEQLKTLAYVGAAIFVPAFVTIVWLLVIEYRTLRDKIPGNHITAVIRALMNEESARGPVIALIVLTASAFWFIAGHLWW